MILLQGLASTFAAEYASIFYVCSPHTLFLLPGASPFYLCINPVARPSRWVMEVACYNRSFTKGRQSFTLGLKTTLLFTVMSLVIVVYKYVPNMH